MYIYEMRVWWEGGGWRGSHCLMELGREAGKVRAHLLCWLCALFPCSAPAPISALSIVLCPCRSQFSHQMLSLVPATYFSYGAFHYLMFFSYSCCAFLHASPPPLCLGALLGALLILCSFSCALLTQLYLAWCSLPYSPPCPPPAR